MKRGFPLAIQNKQFKTVSSDTGLSAGQTATRRGVSSAVMLIIFLGAALYTPTRLKSTYQRSS